MSTSGVQYEQVPADHVVNREALRVLALEVVELAAYDAAGLSPRKRGCEGPIVCQTIDGALAWMRSTKDSDDMWTFGWWCMVAGLNPDEILAHVEAGTVNKVRWGRRSL